MKSNQKEKMTQEITIHRSVRHKHIVGFHGFFEDEDFVYVILELCHRRSLMELHRYVRNSSPSIEIVLRGQWSVDNWYFIAIKIIVHFLQAP